MAAVAGRSTRSLAVMSKLVMLGFLLATLSGCFPYVTSYVHLEAPDVQLARTCGNASPPYLAIYERNGVRFSITLEPWAGHSKAGYLRALAPENVVVSMTQVTGHVIRIDKDREERIQF